jgi:hypothetical protein
VAEHDRARRAAWWRPGVGHAAERNVGNAIYGLILATSVIAVSREYTGDNAGITAVTVIVTAAVFWLAHVYAEVLALEVDERHMPTRREIRNVVRMEWPLVQAGILPTLVLLLGTLDVVDDAGAQDAALAVCLVELGVTGVAAARITGARGALVVVSGLVALSLGVAVTALKVLVH